MTLIDVLIGLPDQYRPTIINNLNPNVKLRIFRSIPTLTELLNLEPIKDYAKRVKLRKEYIDKYPNEVHWDYVDFIPSELYVADNIRTYGLIKSAKISTNGDLVSSPSGVRKIYINLTSERNSGDYTRLRLDGIKYAVHRIVACTFLPKPEHLADKEIHQLISNHIDLNVNNDRMVNLEWVTNGENVKHSFNKDTPIGKKGRKTGENYYSDKYVLMEVVANNRFKGRKWVINGLEQCEAAGFKWPSLRYVIDGSKLHNYGHKASYITADEAEQYHSGIPDDINELFKQNKNYFSMDIKPVIGTIMTGACSGLEFSMFGINEIKRYFSQPNVMKVLSGERKQHAGCTWRHGSIEEAIPLHNKLTPEILFSLLR